MQKVRSSIVLMMIAIAIILAAGVFLAINVVQSRNAEPETFPVSVAGEQIFLQVDPNSRPTIVEQPIVDENPRVEPQPEQPAAENNPTPEPTAVPQENPTAVPAQTVTKVIFIDYVVQQGDTLFGVAQRIDTSIALMAENGISQTSLNPGQTIRLPIGNPEFCASRGRPYAVGEGDTAFNIGQRFNTTAQNLQAINGLDANFTVKVADIICVP